MTAERDSFYKKVNDMTQYERNRGPRNRRQTSGRDRGSSAAGQAARINAVQQARKNTKRNRGPRRDMGKLAVMLVILAVLIGAIIFSAKRCSRTEQPQTETQETQLEKEVTVDGVSITGMSREEAREAILSHYTWGMKVTYEGQEYELLNLMGSKVDHLLEEIFTGEPRESYSLDVSGLETDIEAEVANIAEQWDRPAKNGAISGFDKETGNFIYEDEEYGMLIDRENLAAQIQDALEQKDFDRVIEAKAEQVAPEITRAQAKEMYQVIGTFTTTTTANQDRNTNISLACDALNGLIIQPGAEFSFNQTTGNRTLERGYKPAGAYVNGVLVEEPGGGVCQVSSTLYNAVVYSGLTTTERHAHSYEPSYVTPGEDAMVSYDGYSGPDMKFVNNSSTAVAIRTSFSNQKLTISIVGIPILEEGVTLSMHSEKTVELDPPEPTYEEDQTLEPGVEVVAKAAVNGSRWVTNLITTKNGTVISDEFFHNSTYKGKAATIKRNTSGVVIPDPAQTTDPSADTSAAASTDAAGQTEPQEAGPGISTAAPAATTTAQEPGVESTPAQTAGSDAASETEQPSSPPHSENAVISPNPFAETNS